MTATQDPVTKGLLDLYSAYADRRQAELDLERARTKEQVTGRSTVPSVMAQLQQRAQKEAKQREQIKSQGPSPQSMLPPLTDTTGVPSGRGGAEALGSIADIAQTALLGKSGAAGGAAIGGTPISRGGPQPAAGAPGGNAPTVPAGTPGTVQQVNLPLTATQRVFRGIGAVGAAALRSPVIAAQLGEQAWTGNQPLGVVQTPSVPELAQPLAGPLSILRSRAQDPNPLISQSAKQEYDARMDQIAKEFGPDVAYSAALQAEDINLYAAEKKAEEAADPILTAKRGMAAIENKIQTEGLKSLTQGERDRWEGRKAVTQIIMPGGELEKAQAARIQEDIGNRQNLIQQLDDVDNAWYEPYFTVAGKARWTLLQAKAKTIGLTDTESAELTKFAEMDRATSSLSRENITATGGKTLTPFELSIVIPTIPWSQQDLVTAKNNKDAYREANGLGLMRQEIVLEAGSQLDPRWSMSLTDVRGRAQNKVRERANELHRAGYSDDDVDRQVKLDFKRRYGLDVDRLMARPSSMFEQFKNTPVQVR